MAIVTLYPERENRWAEENRQKKERDGIALVECSDGVWRSAAERSVIEAHRYIDLEQRRQ
jgi:hypothetical protein